MKSRNILNKDLNYLKIDNNIIKKINNNNINTIEELWKLNRRDLKKFSLTDKEINQVIIKLQLCGIDLNHKIY